MPSYTGSKSGLAGLAGLMANEWAAKGINVAAIAQGCILLNNMAAFRADEVRREKIIERIPADRWGKASVLADAVFATDVSDHVKGLALAVSGGWLAR
jgi:2-deoxy-D-gluconate 3-dehydrogenase